MSRVFVPVSYHIAKMSETLPFITNSVQAFFFVGLAVKKRLKCHHGSIGREQTFGEYVLHIFSHKFRCVTAVACLSFISVHSHTEHLEHFSGLLSWVHCFSGPDTRGWGPPLASFWAVDDRLWPTQAVGWLDWRWSPLVVQITLTGCSAKRFVARE